MVKNKQQRADDDSRNNRSVKTAFLSNFALCLGNFLVKRVIAKRVRAGKMRHAHLKYSSQGAQCFEAWLIAVLDTLNRAYAHPGQFGKLLLGPGARKTQRSEFVGITHFLSPNGRWSAPSVARVILRDHDHNPTVT